MVLRDNPLQCQTSHDAVLDSPLQCRSCHREVLNKRPCENKKTGYLEDAKYCAVSTAARHSCVLLTRVFPMIVSLTIGTEIRFMALSLSLKARAVCLCPVFQYRQCGTKPLRSLSSTAKKFKCKPVHSTKLRFPHDEYWGKVSH